MQEKWRPLDPEFSAESDPGPKLPIPTLTVSASTRPRKLSGLTTSQSLHLCQLWKTHVDSHDPAQTPARLLAGGGGGVGEGSVMA